jgi:hypothetical protein
MKKIMPFVFFMILLFSCSGNNQKIEEIQKNQIIMEQQLDSLKSRIKDLEELTITNTNIINDLIKPKPGSLLYELENTK